MRENVEMNNAYEKLIKDCGLDDITLGDILRELTGLHVDIEIAPGVGQIVVQGCEECGTNEEFSYYDSFKIKTCQRDPITIRECLEKIKRRGGFKVLTANKLEIYKASYTECGDE